jgi:hypothetical protein
MRSCAVFTADRKVSLFASAGLVGSVEKSRILKPGCGYLLRIRVNRLGMTTRGPLA